MWTDLILKTTGKNKFNIKINVEFILIFHDQADTI